MPDSTRLKLDVDTDRGDKRELLLERAKELTGEDSASKAIDECIYRAISFEQLVDERRARAREILEELETDHHRVNYSHRLKGRDVGLQRR